MSTEDALLPEEHIAIRGIAQQFPGGIAQQFLCQQDAAGSSQVSGVSFLQLEMSASPLRNASEQGSSKANDPIESFLELHCCLWLSRGIVYVFQRIWDIICAEVSDIAIRNSHDQLADADVRTDREHQEILQRTRRGENPLNLDTCSICLERLPGSLWKPEILDEPIGAWLGTRWVRQPNPHEIQVACPGAHQLKKNFKQYVCRVHREM